LSVDELLGSCSGLEPLDGAPKIVGECLRAGASLALPHLRPLLCHHHPGVRFSKPLNLISLGFGKRLCEVVDHCHVYGFVLHRYPSGIVFVQ
jgi:hypothetical protein